MAAPLFVKGIFECCPVPVSFAILQVWVKVINEVIIWVVQPIVKKAWTVVHAFLWWRHHTCAGHSLFFCQLPGASRGYCLTLGCPMPICIGRILVTPLRHFVVVPLGAGAVGSCGVVVLVAGHASLVYNRPLGCPGIFRLRGWPC